ncbi:MAG: hemerythrin domain-containing protein [Bacteroidales bacterium]|nr:hemerythrin domain-containing protein [Bacteroidales bacterium]
MTAKKNLSGEVSRAVFSPKMKMADLVDLNYHLLTVLDRLNIDLTLGEASVSEVCERNDVDVATFFLVCGIYTFHDYVPSGETLDSVNVMHIIRYLHLSHEFYLHSALVDIADDIELMLAPCDEKHQRIIWRFFSQYKEELSKHFEYEENVVFPYVKALYEHADAPSATPEEVGDDHTNIEEKVEDLKNIVLKYLPRECDSKAIIKVLNGIYRLARDLERHTLIEDSILMPLVNKLEKR